MIGQNIYTLEQLMRQKVQQRHALAEHQRRCQVVRRAARPAGARILYRLGRLSLVWSAR